MLEIPENRILTSDIKNVDQLDAHAHVFHRPDKDVKGARYIPDYDAPLAEWLNMLDANSLKGGTLVQPSFLGTDNSLLLSSIGEARALGYAVDGAAVVSPEIDGEELGNLTNQGIVALRLNLVERPLPDFGSGAWPHFFGHAASANLTIEIHLEANRMLPVLEVIQKYGTALTLDHYALVSDVPQLEHLLRNVDVGNLSIKRSAPYRLPIERDSDSARRVVDLDACLSQHFHADRISWGSDWPHTRYEHLNAG